MKKPIVTLIALLVVGLAVWLFFSFLRPAATLAESTAIGGPQSAANTKSASLAKQTKAEADEDAAIEAAHVAERLRDRKERDEREEREYNTLIVFYGQVLDQFAQPVSTARVEYDSVGGSFEGNRELTTDSQGRFTITGIRGKRLRIRVTHAGYYNNDYGSSYFVYAGNDRGPDFKPDPAKPEIFRLRKKGEAAELIRQEDRVLFVKEDGHARSFSLYDHSRRRDQPDYVILQGVDTTELDKNGKPIRRLEMVVPKGGIQQRTDPFAFVAPSDGYQPSMYYMRPEFFGGQLDYFVKFDNGNYGRFTIGGGSGQYNVESFLNPDQSPNLEYDPAQEITFVRTGRMGIDLLYPASDDPNKPTPKSTPSKPVERPGGSLIERRRNAEPPPAPPPAPPRG